MSLNSPSTQPLRRWQARWWRSIKLRMVVVFLLLAAALAFVFVAGAQRAFTLGWREAARPVVMDYVDRLVHEITGGGATPSVERAEQVVRRLPLTVRIAGPSVNWSSHPDLPALPWGRLGAKEGSAWSQEDWGGDKDWERILQRHSADGHTVFLGVDPRVWERRPRLFVYALVALLGLTGLAWWYVHRTLKPLEVIGAGARRFGSGDFSAPIPSSRAAAGSELGELAHTINTMGRDIHGMLEAKRSLLLAISHELRSPLTRARLHTELLPESVDVMPQREALLRDLRTMNQLVGDLLESERLLGQHTSLQRVPLDLGALARVVAADLMAEQVPGSMEGVQWEVAPDVPVLALDPTRMGLLVRNLLSNAWRHGASGRAPVLRVVCVQEAVRLEVRDFGPGVPTELLPQLAQAFYRPDTARTRSTGGVGLGLYLCRLVALAHGATFECHNADPGLRVSIDIPFTT